MGKSVILLVTHNNILSYMKLWLMLLIKTVMRPLTSSFHILQFSCSVLVHTVVLNKVFMTFHLPALHKLGLGYKLDDVGFESWQGLGICLFTTPSRAALGPPQPPIQWVSGALSLGVKRPGREANHSPPSSQRVRGAIPPLPNKPSWCGAQLKHRDNFTLLYFTLLHFTYSLQDFHQQ
jgi:hypothetical protein